MARQGIRQGLGFVRRLLGYLQQCFVLGLGPEPRRLQREEGEHLAPGRGQSLLRG